MVRALSRALGIALAVLLSGGWSAHAEAQTPGQIAEQVFPHVVVLTAEDRDGRTTLGSGFFVRGNLIATNCHVVAGASRARAKFVLRAVKDYDIAGVVALDETADLCVLWAGVTRLDLADLNVGPGGLGLPLGNEGLIGVGDTVYVVSNPRGLEGTFSQGIVSGFRQEASGRLIQITAPISPGSSGGPVLDARGTVIGVEPGAPTSGGRSQPSRRTPRQHFRNPQTGQIRRRDCHD